MPYADCRVEGFRQNDIVMLQDNKECGDCWFGITIDYDGNITSQKTPCDFMSAKELNKFKKNGGNCNMGWGEYGTHDEFEKSYGLSKNEEIPENVKELSITLFYDKKLELSKMFNNYDSFRKLYIPESKLTEINKQEYIDKDHNILSSDFIGDKCTWYECEFNNSKLTIINGILVNYIRYHCKKY